MKRPFEAFAAFLFAMTILASPAHAAGDEQMDKVDAPGGKMKGPAKPLPSKLPGPAPTFLSDDETAGKPVAPLTVPPVETSKRLVTATLLAFDRAIQTKSFTAFHLEALSKPFADAYPADKLLETFTPFISAQATLNGVDAVEPEFDPPPAIEDSLLKLRGHYATRPMRVLFDFDFAFEDGKWLVNAMTVDLKGTPPPLRTAKATPGGADLPSDAELAKLLADTMADFNAAIQAGGAFETMLAKASQPMKFQVKPAQLKEAFASFIEAKTDLSAVAGADPQYDVGTPRVEGKQLIVSGHYRVLPLFVLFNAEYYHESTGWKLLALSVNTIAPAEYKRGNAIRGDAPASGANDATDKVPDEPLSGPRKPAMKKLPTPDGAPATNDATPGDDMKSQDGMKMKKDK